MPNEQINQEEIAPQITDHMVRKIEIEVAKWTKFVNLSGIITMGLAISCIGTSYHKFTGSASLVFMIIYYIYVRKNFPPTIKYLKQEKKNNKLNKNDVIKLTEIETKHFTFWKFSFTCLLFLLPILLLGSLALGTFDDIVKKYERTTEQTVAKPSCIHSCYSGCKGKDAQR